MIEPAWAIVPAKCPARGKSRLKPVLDDGQRARFARRLLEHVLDVIDESGLFAGVLVATDCEEVAQLAAARGAASIPDGAATTLAAVVDQALGEVERRGARAAAVLMADLPNITAADLHALVGPLGARDVVLVRDHLGRHTNALAVSPPTAIATCFGQRESFQAHRDAAEIAGLRVRVVANEALAFDVDGPADHARLTRARRPAET